MVRHPANDFFTCHSRGFGGQALYIGASVVESIKPDSADLPAVFDRMGQRAHMPFFRLGNIHKSAFRKRICHTFDHGAVKIKSGEFDRQGDLNNVGPHISEHVRKTCCQFVKGLAACMAFSFFINWLSIKASITLPIIGSEGAMIENLMQI